VIRALCDKVYVDAARQVRIEGVLDGSEAAQFYLRGSYTPLVKLSFVLPFSLAE
jgi:hypothetical protein